MLPYGRQDIQDADIAAVIEVLKSDFLTTGPEVPKFEAAVAAAVGAAHGVAVNSATSALHIACLALDLGPGDLLWTSPNTFVASANCARYCGADVDFVDIDPATYNLCPQRFAEKLSVAKAAGRLPKILVPVHMTGQSCAMAEIAALARAHDIRIVEDASHAIGGRYRDRPVGDCAFSDICVFSFHPVKIITTAEGGMAMTQDAGLAARMARLRTHGITRDAALMTHASDGPWYYQQLELGLNYRMTDLHAALGRAQLQRLHAYVARRHALAARYDQALAGLALTPPAQAPEVYSAYHLYVVCLDDPARHRAVFEGLRTAGIGVNLHYIPVHLQPYYRALGHGPGQCPAAEDYYRRAISLPLYPSLAEAEQDRVIETLTQLLA